MLDRAVFSATERTTYAYDALGRQEAVTDQSHTPGGGESTWQTVTSTHYTYDPITGQAGWYDVRVRIYPAEPGTARTSYKSRETA